MQGRKAPKAYRPGRMRIGGELVERKDSAWLESINPADEPPWGRVPMGSAADMAAAVEAAEKAQPAWAALSMAQRAGLIHKLGDAVLARTEEIARIESLDTGNTIGPMRRDVNTAVDRMRFAAGLAYEIKGETVPATPGNIHMTIRQPYGVVGRIIPFNHPIGFAASRIAPAIISGNTMVVKPSEQSPLSASILGEICKAILPPGVVNIVTGARETGEALVRHPRVKRIAFIGQPASGMAIQKAAAETAVKHVTLELGGMNMSMRLAKEEVFGPVMSIFKFANEAEALAIANAIDLGLTAAVWTNDINRALRVAQSVQAGYVWVNGVGQHYRGVPYGGFKNSGICREEGISELLSYTEEKVINIVIGGGDYNPAAG